MFDVTGVVHWYAFFSHPSGIQRVTEKLISCPVLHLNRQVEFVARMVGCDIFYRIDADLLTDLDRPLHRSAAIARLRALFAQSMRLSGLRSLLADARYYHIPHILLGLLSAQAMWAAHHGKGRPRGKGQRAEHLERQSFEPDWSR